MNKSELRRNIRSRKQPSIHAIATKSSRLCKRLARWAPYRKARRILFFASTPREVQLWSLMESAMKEHKKVAVPVFRKGRHSMRACGVGRIADMRMGAYGILQPRAGSGRLLPSGRLQMVLVPGMAFDRRGRRMGRGKGYYDRFLSRCSKKTLRVGIALEEQMMSKVPTDRSDVPMHYVITPKRILRCVKR